MSLCYTMMTNTCWNRIILAALPPDVLWARYGYLSKGSGLVKDLAACSQSCQDSAQCNSVTFYSSKWCSHFSTACKDLLTLSGATTVRFKSSNKPTTPAATTAANAHTISGKACDAVKSGYLSKESGLVKDLAACSQSCQKSA